MREAYDPQARAAAAPVAGGADRVCDLAERGAEGNEPVPDAPVTGPFVPDIVSLDGEPYDMVWYQAPASPAVAPYVLGYTACRVKAPPGHRVHLRIHAHVEPVASVLASGDVFVELRGERFRLPWLSIAGPQCGPVTVVLSGDVECFFVRFHPLGPRMLWSVRGRAYAGSPRLDAVADPAHAPALRAWALAVRRAADFRARVRLSEAFLGTQVPQTNARLGALLVALDALAVGPPSEAARAAGISAASLRRWFREDLGICPRDVAAVGRFQRASERLRRGASNDLRALAADCGFPSLRALRRACARFGDGLPSRMAGTAWAGGGVRAVDVYVPPPEYFR